MLREISLLGHSADDVGMRNTSRRVDVQDG